MNDKPTLFNATIYFSYGQFHVFDASVQLPGCAWTERHYAQGFARREQVVNFRTLLEFGEGDVAVHFGPYQERREHERVIVVSLHVTSGEVVIGGPEEYPNKNSLKVANGHYRLAAAQRISDDDREAIDLYFEMSSNPLRGSEVIRADSELMANMELLETADVA